MSETTPHCWFVTPEDDVIYDIQAVIPVKGRLTFNAKSVEELETVQELAEKIGRGEDISDNVIGVMMMRSIEDAIEQQEFNQ